MIESIEFKNFKVLRNATLPLGKFTLIVGPNGSGKSTVFKAIEALAGRYSPEYASVKSSSSERGGQPSVRAFLSGYEKEVGISLRWVQSQQPSPHPFSDHAHGLGSANIFQIELRASRFFSFSSNEIGAAITLAPDMEMNPQGRNLAGVLDRLRDSAPERFDALNEELGKWLPEFDRVLFETPNQGTRSLLLRTRSGGHAIKAADLSEGTLIALAILTLAYLPKPPPLVCFEEPDHGLHPRLLRDVRDAIYRLAYPESFGEKRDPVQVIATTHNPYFLDLFREHPEEIVIAEKNGLEATFSRLVDRTDLSEILGEANLGEVWYSGVLGGVPAGT